MRVYGTCITAYNPLWPRVWEAVGLDFVFLDTEHIALENLEAILSVPGLDAVFIGPHDLSVSMGLPEQYDHPEVGAAIGQIVRLCRAKGLHVGIHFSEHPDRQVKWIHEGVDMIVHSSDYALFFQRLQADIAYIRKKGGDSGSVAAHPDVI